MSYVSLRRHAAATAAAAVLAAVSFAGPAAAAGTTPSPYMPGHGPASGPTAQGLIMKDGNICDPIRHIGC